MISIINMPMVTVKCINMNADDLMYVIYFIHMMTTVASLYSVGASHDEKMQELKLKF